MTELIYFGPAEGRLLVVATVCEWRPRHADMNVCRRVGTGLEFPAGGLSGPVYERRSFNAYSNFVEGSGGYFKEFRELVVDVMPFVANNTYERCASSTNLNTESTDAFSSRGEFVKKKL